MQNSRNNILVDTSVWIEAYRKSSSNLAVDLKKLLEEYCVVTTGIIIAEVLQGAKTQNDFDSLRVHLVTLPILSEDIGDWEEAAHKSYMARKEGYLVPISDCLIATIAEKNNCKVFTIDKHFKVLKNVRIWTN